MTRLDRVGEQPDRFDRATLRPGSIWTSQSIDSIRTGAIEFRTRMFTIEASGLNSAAAPIGPVYRGPLNVSDSVIGSCPFRRIVALNWAVSSSGRLPSVSIALVSTDMIELRQEHRLADDLDVIRVGVGITGWS